MQAGDGLALEPNLSSPSGQNANQASREMKFKGLISSFCKKAWHEVKTVEE